MNRLPASIRGFVERQKAIPTTELAMGDEQSPYASCWFRAVGAMLLAGRVKPKADNSANLTDVERLCKEANFNQHLFADTALFLTMAKVVQTDRTSEYSVGPNHETFWKHETKGLQATTRWAVLMLIQRFTPNRLWRPSTVKDSGLLEFLAVFFACFDGLAISPDSWGEVMRGFSELPAEDLAKVAARLKLGLDESQCRWTSWLDPKGQEAIVQALYYAHWAYVHEKEGSRWLAPSTIGLGMLGLKKLPPKPLLPDDIKVLPNLCILAGAALPIKDLAVLFRHCKPKKIREYHEFQLDRRRLQEAPADIEPAQELQKLLAGIELPATVSAMLETQSRLGGKVAIRFCSALIKPESPDIMDAIRSHPKLKGYIEPGAPPGYLLVKFRSNPNAFVRRCQELGFEVGVI